MDPSSSSTAAGSTALGKKHRGHPWVVKTSQRCRPSGRPELEVLCIGAPA
jgi:hypothetical protein